MQWLLLVVACLVGGALSLPIRLLVALPSEDVPKLSKGVVRTLGEEMNTTVVGVPQDVLQLVDVLCEGVAKVDPHLLVSFLPRRRSFYVAMVTGQAGLPFLSLARHYTDEAAKVVNPLLVSLDPGPWSLSDALFRLLVSQEWTAMAALLLDGSSFADAVARRMQQLTHPQPLPAFNVDADRSGLGVRLASLQAADRRVLCVCCSPARHLVREARRLGMVGGHWVWILMEGAVSNEAPPYPQGMLGLRLKRQQTNRHSVRSALELVSESVRYLDGNLWLSDNGRKSGISCWNNSTDKPQPHRRISDALHTVVRRQLERESSISREGLEPPSFEILGPGRRWRRLGNVTGPRVSLDAWLRPSSSSLPSTAPRFRVVTAFAPPFVREATRLANGSCLMGVACLRVGNKGKEEIVNAFAEYRAGRMEGVLYNVTCCAGISISLLVSLARDLGFSFDLYLAWDGLFGAPPLWEGISGELVSGSAHIAMSAFSVTSARQQVIDFTVPYYHSGVSCLTSSQYRVVPA